MMTTLSERAQRALDGLGWADMNNPPEVIAATMELARVVKAMADTIGQLDDDLRKLEAGKS